MLTGFAIIFEDNILYCSNENKYTAFEIVLFVEKLISSINPKHSWRLSNIYLKGYRMGKERMIIKHIITENNENIFYCIAGDFPYGSVEANNMLQEFYDKVYTYYKTTEVLKQASKKPIFQEIIEVISDHLWNKYEDLLEEEILEKREPDLQVTNNVLYCGISTQGLPIISQLYSRELLDNLDKEITEENVELYSSNLSAKLATIAMNTVIRAKTSIKEIIIEESNGNKNKKIIIYGDIHKYSLDFFASGEYHQLKKVFKLLKEKIIEEPILQEEFAGDLKKYRHLHDSIQEFYQGGI